MLVKIQSIRTGKMVRKKVPVHGLSSPVAVFAAADALAKRNLNRRADALGRRPRLFRLIRSSRLPAALPTGETLLSLTFKRSGTKALPSLTLATA